MINILNEIYSKKPIFIIFLFLCIFAFASDAKKEVPDILFHDYDCLSFESLSKPDAEKLRSIIPNLELFPEYDYEFDIIIYRMSSEPELTYSRFYDFTGDGIDDIIYNNYVGGEEKLFVIWENQNGKFKIAGLAWGEIAKIILDTSNNLCSFVLVSGLCCGGWIGDIRTFSPEFKDNEISYTEKNKYRFVAVWTSFPDAYEIIPQKRFQIKNDSCSFRDSPEIDDEYNQSWSEHEGMPVYGNIIARLKKYSTGTAYAKFQDESENLWWFVALDTNARVTYNRFYRDTLAYKCGWIDTKFLNTIE